MKVKSFVGPSGREIADTSVEAERRARPARNNRKKRALKLVLENVGLTAWELSQLTGWPYPTCSSLFTALHRDGRIRWDGDKRETGNGGEAHVMVIGRDPKAVDQRRMRLKVEEENRQLKQENAKLCARLEAAELQPTPPKQTGMIRLKIHPNMRRKLTGSLPA